MDEAIDPIVKTLINFMSIDELIQIYSKSVLITDALNDPEVLGLLSIKYDLPLSDSFRELVDAYDEKYVTLRCINRYSKEDCLFKAVAANNLDTVRALVNMFEFSDEIFDRAFVLASENNRIEIREIINDTFKQKMSNRLTDFGKQFYERNKPQNR